jgi:pSer/pThr/pTyr-binding forkhead associated (FHA) protein
LPADSFARPKAIADETALLDIGMLKYPQLQRHSNGMLESISISKPNFIIGRLRDQVDYVLENSSVGKIHAEIVSRDGEYFLVDLNTKNGTYINGTRIPSNKEHEIHSNDRITFANAEHVFLLSVNR